MKKYLVGGAVRDTLLKLPIQEKDWVIVGSTPQEMLKIGYEQVGKNFPVFLHPENHEEYALARTEKKYRIGYTGFTCNSSPLITIEEDLSRRDLTINAMAYDIKNKKIIDPYHGQQDIQLKILRHVSSTFKEDPLRILRVARFAAKLTHMNFTIAPETLTLMKQMIHELFSLSPERVWMETKKALTTDNPQIYFQILQHCGALKILFPELDILFKVPMLHKWYPNKKITVGNHAMEALKKITCLTNNIILRFSILCHDIGKGITPKKKWPQHPNHEILGIVLIDNLCRRLKTSKKTRDFSKIVVQYHEHLHNNTSTISATMLMTLFKAFNCWKYPHRIKQIIKIQQSNNKEHINDQENLNYEENFLYITFAITKNINIQDIIKDGFTGKNITKELYNRRLYALKLWKQQNY